MSRIVLKSDFDGVVSAMLLRSIFRTDDIVFAHPEDILSGDFLFNETDYVLNLPITHAVAAHFTAHRYPGGEDDREWSGAITCVQQVVAAYPKVLENPEAMIWVKTVMDFNVGLIEQMDLGEIEFHLQMGVLIDPLTGMGKRKDFLKSNYYFLLDFIENGLKRPKSDWLEELDLQDRIHYYLSEQPEYDAFLSKHAYLRGPAVIVDKRIVGTVPLGNRYAVFKTFDAPYAIYLYVGKLKETIVLTGVSSPYAKDKHDLGEVFSALGGYGEMSYGTMQLDENYLEEMLEKLITTLNEKRLF